MNPIVGIGELLWDVFPDGRKVAGGAPFNFAFHCHQLGHKALFVSRVGDDELGRELLAEVRRLGLSDELILTDPNRPTGTVNVTVDASGQPGYEIVANVAWDHLEWDDRVAGLADRAAAVCFGTLASRGGITRETVRRLLASRPSERARPLAVYDVNLRPGHVDWDFVDFALGRCDWVKLNDAELRELTAWKGLASPEALIRRLVGEGRTVIVTRGADGCDVHSAAGSIRAPGVPARVVDTVGAGDAFTAAMLCLHREGRPLAECARFANEYAARVCEHQGATPPIGRRSATP